MYEEKNIKESPFLGMAGFGGGGTSPVLMGGSGGGKPGWYVIMGNGSENQRFYGLDIDSSGNIYCGGEDSANAVDPFIAKFDSEGAVQWQYVFRESANDASSFYKVVLDSSGNPHAVGYIVPSSGGQGSLDWLTMKLNSSGTAQWKNILGMAQYEALNDAVMDSSDNLYANGFGWGTAGQGQYDGVIVKYNSSGSVVWQKSVGSINSDRFYGITLDTQGDVISVGYNRGVNTTYYNWVVKYNTSGVIQWQKTINVAGGTQNNYTWDVVTDSSDNIYCCATSNDSNTGLLYKLNSSGALQWIKTTDTFIPQELAIDSSGNIYAGGSESNDATFAKFDSSGNIQWQAKLHPTVSSSYSYVQSMKVSNDGEYLLFSGNIDKGDGNGYMAWLVSVPTDGSLKEGVYDGLTYEKTNFTIANPAATYASNTVSYTAANEGMTENTSFTFTPSNPSFTATKTDMV
jgi:hypothetical protein